MLECPTREGEELKPPETAAAENALGRENPFEKVISCKNVHMWEIFCSSKGGWKLNRGEMSKKMSNHVRSLSVLIWTLLDAFG